MVANPRFFVALLVLNFGFGCHQDLTPQPGFAAPDTSLAAPDGSADTDASASTDTSDSTEDGASVDSGDHAGDGDNHADDGGYLDAGSEPDIDGALDVGALADSGGDADRGSAGDAGRGSAADAGTGSDADAGTGSAADAGTGSDADAGVQPPLDPACLEVDPFPSMLTNTASLTTTQGVLQFLARDGNTLNAYTHRSPLFDPATGQIVFIMHGANRNADTYLDKWRSYVDQHNVLAIAPEFPKDKYPGSEDYQLGVGTSGTPYTATYAPSDWRAPHDYTHSEIEHLFEALRAELGNASCRYLIYGHSAGSQFVHRLLTFRPDARVATAVAANAGWYTLPSDGGGWDPNFYMPYGLQGAPPDAKRLEKLFAHDLVVLLGEDDVNRGSYLRTRPQADAQGLNRLERGHFYYAAGQQEALSQGVPFRWTLDTVPNVGHSNTGMTPAAATHLFGP